MANDLSKLPKWAQSEIERLRANEAYYKKRAAALGEVRTLIEVDPPMDPNTPRKFLDESSRVAYKVANGELNVFLRDGKLEVMATLGGSIKILPRAANVIECEVGV